MAAFGSPQRTKKGRILLSSPLDFKDDIAGFS
jgi:hypothetical protein